MGLMTSESFSNLPAVIEPALRDINFGDGVLNARVHYSFVEDKLSLMVEHKLLSRVEMERGPNWHRLVSPRLRRALLADGPPPGKEIRAERRQLLFRGEAARKSKARIK